jgi:hypothetical protein
MKRAIVIRGQRFITLSEAAKCYEVKVTWVREVFEFGLLGEGEETKAGLCIAAEMLERLATIRRMELQQGLNLAGIALLLDLT